MHAQLFTEPAEAVSQTADLIEHSHWPVHRHITSARTPNEQLIYDYESVRLFTHTLAAPLTIEDYVVQSMPDVSPTKWHLAHTSWFYERFILHEHVPNYQPVSEDYYYLFNSYYNGAGPQHCRPSRGLISRPTVAQVYDYRRLIDERMIELLQQADASQLRTLEPLVVLGLNHEQQHQELLLTDIKHVLSSSPLLPAYREPPTLSRQPSRVDKQWRWRLFDAGLYEIGHSGPAFCYDNETPRHQTYVHSFEIATRPVTNADYLTFIEDDGYRRPELWLSAGYATIQQHQWEQPIYWYRDGDRWMQFTLLGPQPLHGDEPVCHLSYFEADAFARWSGSRLPTEAEWEIACRDEPRDGTFVESLAFHPQPLSAAEYVDGDRLHRCFGDVWEWTGSQYTPYPGYRPPTGALGEYNGKFMCNQFILRGGSCATSRSHIRATYRNFFAPESRWQFTGLRLARDREP